MLGSLGKSVYLVAATNANSFVETFVSKRNRPPPPIFDMLGILLLLPPSKRGGEERV